MTTQTTKLTRKQKRLIVSALWEHFSLSFIANILGCRVKTLYPLAERMRKVGYVLPAKTKTGRPKKEKEQNK